MALPALLLPLLTQLAGNGLQTVADAVQAKGKRYVEEKLGVEIKPDMTPAELAALRDAAMQHEVALVRICEEAITARHKSDMGSDSWMSKNVRPLALIYLMALFTLAFTIEVPESVLTMLRDLLMTVFVFYFGSRTVEKVVHSFKGAPK